ncbi:MAG: hypothetical protein IPJ37_03005 [Bacteroidales bacterium]|nr:hypothetical protein [Bacteroidales bacterium]
MAPVSVTVKTALPAASSTVTSLTATLDTSSSVMVPTPIASVIVAVPVLRTLLRVTSKVSDGSLIRF